MPAHHLSASKTDLGRHCLYWARADVPQPHPLPAKAAAKVGVEFHAKAADDVNATETAGGVKLTKGERARLVALYEEFAQASWPEGERRAEVPLALDPVSMEAMELPASPNGHRDYSAVEERFVPMTADVLLSGSAVIDYKTGRYVPPASESGQLKTIALALVILTGKTEIRAAHGVISESGCKFDEVTFDAFDLLDWRGQLADMMRKLPTAQPEPGPHCRSMYCPQFGACPATAGALDHVAGELKRRLPIVTLSTDIEGPDHAAYQYQALRAAKARIDAAWEALRRWSDQHGGIPLPDGSTWIRRETQRESINLEHPGAFDALRGELGEDWRAAVSVDTSKAAIKRAARLVAKQTGETIAAIEARVLNTLRAEGAITSSPSATYDEVKHLKGG